MISYSLLLVILYLQSGSSSSELESPDSVCDEWGDNLLDVLEGLLILACPDQIMLLRKYLYVVSILLYSCCVGLQQ